MKIAGRIYGLAGVILLLMMGLWVPSGHAFLTEYTFGSLLNPSTTHDWLFKTAGGEFTVKPDYGNDFKRGSAITYHIYDIDKKVEYQPTYNYPTMKIFNLPAGSYYFSVAGATYHSESYRYNFSGPVTDDPDAWQAELADSMPGPGVIGRSNNNKISTILFQGTVDAASLTLSTPNSSVELPIIQNMNNYPYSINQSVDIGINQFQLRAVTKTGNAVTSFTKVIIDGIKRLGGADRYEVSSNISHEVGRLEGSKNGTIVIARGDVFSDALSGGTLASINHAPILLTATNQIPDSVKKEISEKNPTRAIILGGTGSVSPEVENTLKEMGIPSVKRIGAADRYGVSAGVAEEISRIKNPDTAIIASGEVFPDALSASSIGGKIGMPILLVSSNTVPEPIKEYVKNHPEIQKFIIVGGPATVKDTVISQLKSIRGTAKVVRIGGQNRYQVSCNVAQYGMDNYGLRLDGLVFARGDLFPDALSGSTLANFYNAPILLTPTNQIDPSINSFLDQHLYQTQYIFLLGGTGSISENTESQLSRRVM